MIFLPEIIRPFPPSLSLLKCFLLSFLSQVTETEDDYSLAEDTESEIRTKLKKFYRTELEEYDPIILSFENSYKARMKGKVQLLLISKRMEIASIFLKLY